MSPPKLELGFWSFGDYIQLLLLFNLASPHLCFCAVEVFKFDANLVSFGGERGGRSIYSGVVYIYFAKYIIVMPF